MVIGMEITNLGMMLMAAPMCLVILLLIDTVALILTAILILIQLLTGAVYLKADIVRLTVFH